MGTKIVLLVLAAVAAAEPPPISYTLTVPSHSLTKLDLYNNVPIPYQNPLFKNINYLPAIPSPAYVPSVTPVLPATPPTAPVLTADLKNQYYIRDALGQAIYGHSEPGQNHHAVHDYAGNKAGSFSYYNADGRLIQTSYIADANGYRVSSNDLPVAPTYLPLPPQDTPEVAAAKASHLVELAKAQGRVRREAQYFPQINTNGIPQIFSQQHDNVASTIFPQAPRGIPQTTIFSKNPASNIFQTSSQGIPRLTANGYLEDTPEVQAAKAQHFAEVAKYNVANNPASTIFSQSFKGIPQTIPFSNENLASNIFQTSSQGIPRLTANGYLEDTPEVQAAKAQHFAEVAKYNVANNPASTIFSQSFKGIPQTIPFSNENLASNIFQTSSQGIPRLTANGYLEDTPEVKAAKAQHFAEVAKFKG